MHWKFEPFFSIVIQHGKYPPPLLGTPAPPAPEFSVVPTHNTQRRLVGMGWVFKSHLAGGGGTLYAEKIITADGTAKLRTSPAQGEGFTFVLRLTDSSILGQTKPYTTTPSVLPPFSGRTRLLYFDNLTAVAQTDGSFLLTKGAFTDVAEFASRAPVIFDFPATQAGPGTVKATALHPNPPALKSFNIPAASRFARLELDENAYKITQNSSTQSETIYITTERLPDNTLGIIRLFNIPTAPIDQNKQFQIVFAKA